MSPIDLKSAVAPSIAPTKGSLANFLNRLQISTIMKNRFCAKSLTNYKGKTLKAPSLAGAILSGQKMIKNRQKMKKNRFFQIDPECFKDTSTTHFWCPEYDFDDILIQKRQMGYLIPKTKTPNSGYSRFAREVPWVHKSAKNRFFQIDCKCTQDACGTQFRCSGYDFDHISIQKRQMGYLIPKTNIPNSWFSRFAREVPWVQKSAKNLFFQIECKCTQDACGTEFGCPEYDLDQVSN